VTTGKIVSAVRPHKSTIRLVEGLRSTFRVAPADVVKALLDCGEARFDHRLKFEVGEDIWPVIFDAFADEFTGIDGIYALRDACPDHIDLHGEARTARTKRSSRSFSQLRRFHHVINSNKVFGTHRDE
jgi:hypothetical protein